MDMGVGKGGLGLGLFRQTHHSLFGSESSKLPSSCVPISLSYGGRAGQDVERISPGNGSGRAANRVSKTSPTFVWWLSIIN